MENSRDDPGHRRRREQTIQPVHEPTMLGKKRAHIFNSQVSFELGLNEIPERGGTGKK